MALIDGKALFFVGLVNSSKTTPANILAYAQNMTRLLSEFFGNATLDGVDIAIG